MLKYADSQVIDPDRYSRWAKRRQGPFDGELFRLMLDEAVDTLKIADPEAVHLAVALAANDAMIYDSLKRMGYDDR